MKSCFSTASSDFLLEEEGGYKSIRRGAASPRSGHARADLVNLDLVSAVVVLVWVPPLRERGNDVLRLADHFLARACSEYGLPPKSFAVDAQAELAAYRWPGNVRELSNVIERVALLAEAPEVTAALLALPGT